MVKAPDMKFRGRWFKSDSDHKLELFLSRPRFKFSVMFLKSQLVCLPPDRRPKSVPSLFYLFSTCERAEFNKSSNLIGSWSGRNVLFYGYNSTRALIGC